MKRWIHASSDYDRLKFINKKGEVDYLPTWYIDRSDEEVEKAKQILINAPEGQYTEFHEIKIPNEAKLRRDLKEEGFIKPEIEEIIEYIYSGGTVDAAIQRQLDLRGGTNICASRASRSLGRLDGFVSWNGYNYGRLRGKGTQPDRYFKSKTVRFDDSMGGTEEVSEDEYFEAARKYAGVMREDY